MVRAELVQVTREDTRAQAVVLFTDDTTFKRLDTFDLLNENEDSFKQRVENRRAQLELSVAFVAKIAPGMDLSITPSVDPDPVRTQFLADHRQFQAMTRAIALGYTTADKTYADLQAKLQAAWMPDYVGFV